MDVLLVIYLFIVNIVGFCAMGVDKSRAKRSAWRIPERTLFLLAAFGGSIGVWGGMYAFRHKTKHMSFVLGIPLILVVHLLLILMLSIKN